MGWPTGRGVSCCVHCCLWLCCCKCRAPQLLAAAASATGAAAAVRLLSRRALHQRLQRPHCLQLLLRALRCRRQGCWIGHASAEQHGCCLGGSVGVRDIGVQVGGCRMAAVVPVVMFSPWAFVAASAALTPPIHLLFRCGLQQACRQRMTATEPPRMHLMTENAISVTALKTLPGPTPTAHQG